MLKERELKILEIIAGSNEPVGSWFIVNKLEEDQISVSSATVGRYLNHLEQRGYLKKHGIKGRTITPKGQEIVEYTYKSQNLETHKENLDKLINSKVLNTFLQVLEARKAIEKTIARLAAEHITDEELETLESILTRQQKAYAEHKSAAQNDIDFHKTIALASRNDALYSLYMMLSMMGQQSELFEELLQRLHIPYMGSHRAIYEALKKHAPDEAELCMEAHLNRLRKDVNTFWHEFSEHKSIGVHS